MAQSALPGSARGLARGFVPRRGALALAVQGALLLGVGAYAPRIRAQQITCPAVSVTVTAAGEFNSVNGRSFSKWAPSWSAAVTGSRCW
jgi:hypothetical protein